MTPSRARVWRHLAFPEIGGRIAARSAMRRRLPFAAWLHYAVFGWATPRVAAVAAVGIAPMAVVFLFQAGVAFVQVAFALSGAILAGIALGGLLRPRVGLLAQPPARVERGREFTIRYDVWNAGRRTLIDLRVGLMRTSGLFDIAFEPANIPALAVGARCGVEGRGKARLRGLFRLPPLRCDSDFPSGMWLWGRTDWTERRLSVYPSYARLEDLDLPEGARNRLDVQSARHLARSALEFHGCREFRVGDSLRHVHARSSARLGAPVVKEFQAEGRGRTAILVDTWRRVPSPELGLRPDPVVEAALSLAAAVTDFLSQSDRELELLVAGPGVYRFESAGRQGFLEDVLDILASVETSVRDTLPQLSPVLVSEIRAIESVCLILGRWDRVRADLVDSLAAEGIGVKVVLVTRREGSPKAGLPTGARQVSCRAVRRGEVLSL